MARIITKGYLNEVKFYQMPKAFYHNPKYTLLMNETKLAYMMLRDLISLSDKKGWVNENDEVYVKISRERLMLRLQIKGSQKIAKVFKELLDNELIIENRMGQGKINQTYICIPDELSTVIYDDEELLELIEEMEKSQTFENQSSSESIDNHMTFENQSSRKWEIKVLENIISKSKTFENQRHINTKVDKTDMSDTNISKTNLSKLTDINNKKQQQLTEIKTEISDTWFSYYQSQIPKNTLLLLINLASQFDLEIILTIIGQTLNADKSINAYINGIANKLRIANVKTFDDYYEYDNKWKSAD